MTTRELVDKDFECIDGKFYLVYDRDSYRAAAEHYHGKPPRPLTDRPSRYPALVYFDTPDGWLSGKIRATSIPVADLNRHITLGRRTISALLENGVDPFTTTNYSEKELLSLNQLGRPGLKEIRTWEQLRGYCRMTQDEPATFIGDQERVSGVRGDVTRLVKRIHEDSDGIEWLAKAQAAHLKTLENLSRLLTTMETALVDRHTLAVELRQLADTLETLEHPQTDTSN